MPVATVLGMICLQEKVLVWGAFLGIAAPLFGAIPAYGAAVGLEEPTSVTAAEIWLPAYGVWVDRSLTNEQLEQASKELVAPGTEESATLLDRLVRDQIEALPATVPLPDYVVPPPYSPSASEGVPPPSPMEPYLAVQLLDEQLGEVDPSVKLDLIDRYRAALRLGPGASAANRGRLRIGQIYLDLGFIPEARAEFRSLTEGTELEPELAVRLAMSHAEASLRAPDVTRALEELEGLDLDQLPTEARRWAHRRRGDVLFSLHRFPPAVDEYRSARDLGAVDETLVMRLAISEIESGAPQEAIETLDPIRDASTRVGGLAALLRAQAHSKLGDTDGSISAAAQLLGSDAPAELVALAGVRVLLGGRPRETPDLIVAPESVELLENRGDSEAIGLLAYELAKVPILGETKTEKRRRIGEALAPLPEGAVAALVSRDLAWEIGAHLFAFLRGESSLDPEVLEDLELYLSRPTVPEGFALLALETFYRTRDRSACLAWARVVHSREVRPIRRGLSVWRRAHCSGRLPPPAISGQALVEIADSGEAGDYSLPIVALAAEGEVSEGNVKGAIELYERGLLSLGTPAVRGPVFLRLGELLDSVGRGSMASRPLFRGLALLEPDLPQATPFRALGLMTLFRLAERRALTSIARSAARRELDTFSAEWRGPLGYLAYRSELSDVPPGKGLFARATKQIKGAKSISTQLRRKTEPTGSSSVRGPSK